MNQTPAITRPGLRPWLLVTLAATLALPACDDGPVDPPPQAATHLGVVLGSVDLSLTIFPADSPHVTRTVGLGPDGTPVTFAVHDGLAAVPMGTVPAVAVVDLLAGTLLRTIALPNGSGATGIDFLNDSIALVANPGLGSVTPVNVLAGTTGAEIPVGVYPQAVMTNGERTFVLDGNLVNFAPDGPGAVIVLSSSTLTVTDSIPLSGTNPGTMAMALDNGLNVLNSGSFGSGDGSLSVVDFGSPPEAEHHVGFGDFPGGLVVGLDGTMYVSAFSYGIAVWDPSTGSFLIPPDAAVEPAGIGSASGLALDLDQRLWTLEPECGGPGHAFRLDASYSVADSAIVGVCPIAIEFTLATLP